MMSERQIQRIFTTGRHPQLLDAAERSGLVVPLPIKARLSATAVAPVALGLRRLCSLTYRPTDLMRDMTGLLFDAQREDGSFDGDVLVTAGAVAALDAVARLSPALPLFAQLPGKHADPLLHVPAVREQAIAFLLRMQCEDGLFACDDDRTQDDRLTTSAFIAYLLADCDAFRQSIRIADLMGQLDEHRHNCPQVVAQLIDLAHVTIPQTPVTQESQALAA